MLDLQVAPSSIGSIGRSYCEIYDKYLKNPQFQKFIPEFRNSRAEEMSLLGAEL